MKKYKLVAFFLLLFFAFGCEEMDNNYKVYLEDVQVYSPRVTDLVAAQGLKEVTLNWKNPAGNIAQKNAIMLEDSTIVIDSLVESYHLTNLEIRGYQVSVYTIDSHNNFSIPATINIFPNGE